jgi:hypothetical protein
MIKDNWRNICEWLQEAGYRAQPPAQSPAMNLFPEKSVVNINNIIIESTQIVIVINLRIPTSPASEPPKEDLNSNGLTDI